MNICWHARRLSGVDRLYAVIGGFHLDGPRFEPIIRETCDALIELASESIVPLPLHRWKATHHPGSPAARRLIQNSVGPPTTPRARHPA